MLSAELQGKAKEGSSAPSCAEAESCDLHGALAARCGFSCVLSPAYGVFWTGPASSFEPFLLKGSASIRCSVAPSREERIQIESISNPESDTNTTFQNNFWIPLSTSGLPR